MAERTMLQSLLRYPHAAVFDKAPGAELALRVRHPAGAAWSVADEVLTVTAGSADPVEYHLGDYTVGELAAELVSAGFEVPMVAPSWAGRSALVLVEGAGNDAVSNGDHVTAFTSLLWALYSGYAGELRDAKYQIGQALRQMVIPQAEGEWLDVWGTLYGDARRQDESDADYAPRIPQEAFRLRVNALGIEKAILDGTGFDVRINEPWKDVFRLDESLLSGPHRFYDGERIGYHLIQPTSNQEVDWSVVLPIIERNRPAGVMVLGPFVRRIKQIEASLGLVVHGGGTSENTAYDRYQDRQLLDYNVTLDDGSDIILNHLARRRHEIMRSSGFAVPSQPWGTLPWGSGDWSAPYIVGGAHIRDYRVYYLDLNYSSQFWTSQRSWSGAASDWSGLNPIIDAGHTRS